MAHLGTEVKTLCAELSSDKITIRNKAVDRLEVLITNFRNELSEVFKDRRNEFSFVELFNSVIEAILKHVEKIEQAHDTKNAQTLRNKNYVYASIINKIIDYNMEGNFLPKICLLNAFSNGTGGRTVLSNFGEMFLNILDRGLLKSPSNIRDLKVSEYSLILSHLFEVNIGNDNFIRFALLRSIIKTIEIANDYVQIGGDLINYLPEIFILACKAAEDRHKGDVIKLFYLFMSQLSIDYNYTIGVELQKLVPIICNFYHIQFKPDIKLYFFDALHLSLLTVYPNIQQGNLSPSHVFPLDEKWAKTLKRLRAVVDIEINGNKSLYLSEKIANQKYFSHFIKVAALVIYLENWSGEAETSKSSGDSTERRSKVSKGNDILEKLLDNIDSNDVKTNDIWLAILGEILQSYSEIINISNYQKVLEFSHNTLRKGSSSPTVYRSLRFCIGAILQQEKNIFGVVGTSTLKFSGVWLKIVDLLIGEPVIDQEIVIEKQLLLQILIIDGKLSEENCQSLLLSFLSNSIFRREECMETTRQIFMNANEYGIDKNCDVVRRVITWLYEVPDNKIVLYSQRPIETELIADTCAVAVINFLKGHLYHSNENASHMTDLQKAKFLLYKYNKLSICLEEHGKKVKLLRDLNTFENDSDKKNCLLQSNYDFAMRLLNYETSNGNSHRDIVASLKSLHHRVCLMKQFLAYGVFNGDNYTQCPLVKRIGLYFSDLEFQLKNHNCREFDETNTFNVMHQLGKVLSVFISNKTLLEYLEKQTLDELLVFLRRYLTLPDTLSSSCDADNWSRVSRECLKILASLCSSASHCKDAFAYMMEYQFNIITDVKSFLEMTKIICGQSKVDNKVAGWLVNKLKAVFTMFNRHFEIMHELVELLPAIFTYIQGIADLQENMLIALTSLLKIAYRKSYSSLLTTKIINSIRVIVQQSNNLCSQQNFINICQSVVAFITIPSLEIQYAAINTITGLLSADWVGSEITDTEGHLNFAEQIFSKIDWRNLSTDTVDLTQNSNSVTVQLLVAIFMFSSYHQEIALQELVYLCALRKLTEADLCLLKDLGCYYNCTLGELTTPYIQNSIHLWLSKQYPILKFPYFLFYNTNEEFIDKNLPIIVTFLLAYSGLNELKKIAKIPHSGDYLNRAVPVLQALISLFQSGYGESSNNLDYKTRMNKLIETTNSLNAGILESSESTNWETLYYMLDFVNEKSLRIDSSLVLHIIDKWYHISCESLTKSLKCSGVNKNKTNLIVRLLADDAVDMLKLFGLLKVQILRCKFKNFKLKVFNMFCILIEMIIDMVDVAGSGKQHHQLTSALESNVTFFVNDAIRFNLQCIEDECQSVIRKASLKCLLMVVRKPIDGNCRQAVEETLHDMCKVLISCAESSNSGNDIENISMEILRYLLIENVKNDTAAIEFFDEFPKSAKFSNIFDKHMSNRSPNESWVITKKSGVEKLKSIRQNIAKNKQQLYSNQEAMSALIKRLLDIVRNSEVPSINAEALKCLGVIGPLGIADVCYYFETDRNLFYENVSKFPTSLHWFVKKMFAIVENIINVFKCSSFKAVDDLAQILVNSKPGQELLNKNPGDHSRYFHLFLKIPQMPENCLDGFKSLATIDFVNIFEGVEPLLNYSNWIREFVSKVFESCGWLEFAVLASKDSTFAEESLKPFIKLLMVKKERHLDSLIALVEYFFSKWNKESPANIEDKSRTPIYRDKRVVGMFLNFCECIRIHNNWKIPIDLLSVVRASNYCQSYFMSVLYLELWADNEKYTRENQKDKSEIMSNEVFQETAMEAYKRIGCNDAVSGILNPFQSRLNYLYLDNNWPDILLETDTNKELSNEMHRSILKRNGMLNLANSTQSKDKIDYEICWRLCQWDLRVDGNSTTNMANDIEYEFERHHYNSLKCLFQREENNCLASLSNARQCISSIIKENSIECLQSVYKFLTWLQLGQEIEDFCKVQFSTTPVADVFSKWDEDIKLPFGNFQCKEMVISHRITLFNTAGIRVNRKVKEYYKDNPVEVYLLKNIQECQRAKEINLTKRSIALLKSMELTNERIKINVLLEDAKVSLKTGRPEITKATLHHVITSKEFLYCLQRIRAIRMFGKYLMESNTEAVESVIRKYFRGSLELLKQMGNSKEQILKKYPNAFGSESFEVFDKKCHRSAYKAIAKYADKEYTQVNAYVISEEFQMKNTIMKKNRQTANSVTKQSIDKDRNMGASVMKRFANLDEQEFVSMEQKHLDYLCIAVENYIKFCQIDEQKSSPEIYRIVALWFANKQNTILHEKIKENIQTIPSYKFLCALNQMTARLSSKNQEFLNILKEILMKCIQDHPQQSLYQLFALVFAYHDVENSNKKVGRVAIAREIIASAKNKFNSECIKQMEILFPALIEFANQASDGKKISMPLSVKLRRLKNLDAIQCPTIELPASSSKQYNITSVIHWEEKVKMVGGINAPKKLTCICSDGRQYEQLLKGKDDLRQDAVMQQVFSMINDLFMLNTATAQRKLVLRTYKIVPLSTRCGILEWCQNTIPIGAYLSGANGAHKRYRPNDYTHEKCRLLLRDNKETLDKRYKVYKHICENIKPVFHYFLLERFLVPGVWFERRLAYTNSVAANSMVGFVLGLGDRHTHNILIDENTAEVIHIDFGICFEQGKIMPTPETVPFRLTRDMVAPMGISEANGVFKKSCEVVMETLRHHHSVINTILEVLLYDPLYIWSILSSTNKEGNDGNEEKNLTAQRALLCVQNKLEGKQTGTLGTSSVSVQVDRLINEAMSAKNLCQLFHGWDPYL